MSVEQVLRELGGVATRSQLLARLDRGDLDRAVAGASVLRLARDRYALPTADSAVRTAHALSGVLCLTSAALHHGWAVKAVPDLPHVAVRRKRKLTREQRAMAEIHRHDLLPGDVADGIATTREVTLLHCLRSLPSDEALAVADSALRDGEEALLRRVAATARGAGAAHVRTIVAAARAEAANPFESVLRWIASTVPGLQVEPQRLITGVSPWVRPDLVDESLGIILEADSFEWHGDRAALRRDSRRYDRLVAAGWLVLRFAWEDVMFDQEFVRRTLVDTVRIATRRTQAPCERCGAA